MCDLPITLDAPPIDHGIAQLHRDLHRANLRFGPYFWLSDSWFTPDETYGIAIPFYLAHPRLRRIERSQMLDVEGGTRESFLQILRHETGHAVDNAYALHKRPEYKKLFGNYSQKYPETYRPRRHSKDFVTHLDMWYAQSHPAEDFAETFAVWLNPKSTWRQRYAHWPALKKLQLIDKMMREIANARPIIKSREVYKPLRKLRMTLSEHYDEKRKFYLRTHPRLAARELKRIFSDGAASAPAADFLGSRRAHLRDTVSRWTGESVLTIDAALVDIEIAVRRLHLHLHRPADEAEQEIAVALAVETLKYLSGPRHRIVV